jgi:hypothetical protein
MNEIRRGPRAVAASRTIALPMSVPAKAGEARSARLELIAGTATMVGAALFAVIVTAIQAWLPGNGERAILAIGLAAAAVLPIPILADLFWRRRVEPRRVAVLALSGLLVVLSGVYLSEALAYARFPADLFIWSESDFVNDILKLRLGYPLFTAQENNESFTYMPGAQLITLAVSTLVGRPDSVTVYRIVQLGFTVIAAAVALLCARRLLSLSTGGRVVPGIVWTAAWVPLLFLIASNSITNGFVHFLHNDALTQLWTVIAYWALLEYIATRRTGWLAVMAVIPAVGFMVKQSLIVWAPLFIAYLAIFDRPRSIKRIAVFAGATLALVAGVVGGCVLVWGDPFIYWAFTVLGSHGVSPVRSIEHALIVWPFLAIGLVGGLVLVRGPAERPLAGAWLCWLAIIAAETYTSGIAWMLNHIGPGSLLAGIWFAAALARLAPFQQRRARETAAGPRQWLRAGAAFAVLALVCAGLGLIRPPVPVVPPDASRYAAAIESEFAGLPAASVLLDMGTWVYLEDRVVMKDRAPSIGERGYSQTGNFSAMLGRLRDQQYAKILVHNLHSPDLWYDHHSWEKSSEIRSTLLANYHEVRTIPAVEGWVGRETIPYGLNEVSVLVPIDRSANHEVHP